MTGLVASFRAECRDTFRHPLTWIGVAATAGCAWIFGAHSPLKANGYLVFEAALQPASRIAGFFLMGIAAVAVAGARARGTVRFVLPRPVSRQAWVLGKACALLVLAVAFLAVAVGTSWIVARGHGFGDVVAESRPGGDGSGFHIIEEEEVPPEFQAATMRRRTVAAALLVLPALLTVTGIGLFISSAMSSAAGAVILAVAVVLPLQYLPEVVGLSERTARVLPIRAATDFLNQVRQFGRHLATADWPEYGLGPLAGAAIAILALPWAAALLFSRLDITE